MELRRRQQEQLTREVALAILILSGARYTVGVIVRQPNPLVSGDAHWVSVLALLVVAALVAGNVLLRWPTARPLAFIVAGVCAVYSTAFFWVSGLAPVVMMLWLLGGVVIAIWSRAPTPCWVWTAGIAGAAVLVLGLQSTVPELRPSQAFLSLGSLADNVAAVCLVALTIGTTLHILIRLWEANLRLRLERDAQVVARAFLEQQATVSLMARGVVHDARNVLTPTLLGIDLLRHKLRASGRSQPEEQAALDSIVRNTGKVGKLLGLLMTYSGARTDINAPTDIDRTVQEVLPILRTQLPPGASLEVVSAGTLPAVPLNELMLFQVLVNLVKNASDARVPDRPLRIVLELAARDGVDLSVSDNGSGIPAEMLDDIFRLEYSTKGEAGFGVGLATVRALLTKVGGEIEVMSTVGVGTRFRIHLPAASTEATASTAATAGEE